MKVSDAQICLDCDEVYSDELDCCPGCGSCSAVALKNWLQPLPAREEIDEETRSQALSRFVDNTFLQIRGMAVAMKEMARDLGMEDNAEQLGVCV